MNFMIIKNKMLSISQRCYLWNECTANANGYWL